MNQQLSFRVGAYYLVEVPEELPLETPWEIPEEEISASGREALRLLSSKTSKLAARAQELAWSSQALVEFQDLQGMPVPRAGRFFNTPFLFLEALRCTREAILAGVNGQLHASFAALRSAMEMFVFHSWWKAKLFAEPSYEEFHGWLFGEKGAPPFRNAREDFFANNPLPPGARGLAAFSQSYQRLNSYAHKPRLQEAVTVLRGGNVVEARADVLDYWVRTVVECLRCVLDVCIAASPQSVFPLKLERKFGFYPPLGIFFDQANYLPLRESLGETLLESYRAFYQEKDPPLSPLEWARSHRDLSDDEILATWKEEETLGPPDEPADRRILRGCRVMRAKTRGLHMLWLTCRARLRLKATTINRSTGINWRRTQPTRASGFPFLSRTRTSLPRSRSVSTNPARWAQSYERPPNCSNRAEADDRRGESVLRFANLAVTSNTPLNLPAAYGRRRLAPTLI